MWVEGGWGGGVWQRLEKRGSNNSCTSLSELRSCVKVEVDVLGFPSIISMMVSVQT